MIEVNNLTRNKIDEDFLKRVAEKVLARRNFDLSIALVDEKRIKELNKLYRKKNLAVEEDKSSSSPFTAARVTDVLSFDYDDSGEIVICLSQVKKNARNFNSTFKKELARVLIHGILHLLGFNHEKNEREADKMRKKEADYLFSEMN